MKTPFLGFGPSALWALAAVALLGTGCMTTNYEKLNRNVHRWVPVGTAPDEAIQIMTRHGFQCKPPRRFPYQRPGEGPQVLCTRENHLLNRQWVVRLYLEDN